MNNLCKHGLESYEREKIYNLSPTKADHDKLIDVILFLYTHSYKIEEKYNIADCDRIVTYKNKLDLLIKIFLIYINEIHEAIEKDGDLTGLAFLIFEDHKDMIKKIIDKSEQMKPAQKRNNYQNDTEYRERLSMLLSNYVNNNLHLFIKE
jgi:hypothetical protein